MPSLPRCEIFDPDRVGVYHCWSRCVRRACLFGWDGVAKKDYSYRKQWIREGLKRLTGAMAVDVLDYAILDNHLHTVLRNRPDVVALWSDEEVARRWWRLCPERTEPDGSPAEPTPFELKLLQSDPEELAEMRRRLSDISWFMRLLKQPVAFRANQEDGETGHFFAERFGSEPIESLAQLLACSMYVDLNLIRAGVALAPETSEYTSAYDRICGRMQRQRAQAVLPEPARSGDDDDWLAPIYLDPRSAAYQDPSQVAAANRLSDADAPPRASNKGFLPITLDEYLTLLDYTGRQLRSDKRGAIPADLASILERLGIEPQYWIGALQCYAPRTRRPEGRCAADVADGAGVDRGSPRPPGQQVAVGRGARRGQRQRSSTPSRRTEAAARRSAAPPRGEPARSAT